MSLYDDAGGARTPVRIRVVLLADVLEQASDTSSLRSAVLDEALKGKYQLYWPIPADQMAFSGPEESLDPQSPKSIKFPGQPDPEARTARPNVRFVRLTPMVVQQFADNYAASSLFHNAVFETDFKSGLFIPDEFSASSGILEVTAFSTRIFLSNHENAGIAPTANLNTKRVSPGIQFRDVYIDERSSDDVLFQLHNPTPVSPETHTRISLKEIEGASATPERSARAPTDTKLETANAQPDVKASEVDDPYELKGRSDGVYILYRTTQHCAKNPEFSSDDVSKRHRIALTTFEQLLEEMSKGDDVENKRYKNLQKLYGPTRLNHALVLIDPKYNPRNGIKGGLTRADWPPVKGKSFLAQPDDRRKPFVSDMLALIIGGVETWIDLGANFPEGQTKQQVLLAWLLDHGVANVGQLKTVFAAICWNGSGAIPTPPKSAPPSPSNAPLATKSQKSRRRV